MRFGKEDLKYVGLLFVGLAIIVGCLLLAGAGPLNAAESLYRGTLGRADAIGGTLRETTPLLIGGAAVYLALQGGLFNIGAEGQLTVGALSATWVALNVPGIGGICLALLAAAAAGLLWALPAGLIKAYRNGHEVITTIMLNNVAIFITTAIVAGPLRDRSQQSPTTSVLAPSSRLPLLCRSAGLEIGSGILFGLVAVALIGWWLFQTVPGYELRALGRNLRAAKLAGISVISGIVTCMAASGAIAGVGGAVQALGYEGRFYANFSPGYGFTALGVGLLAGRNPLSLIPAALFFGILSRGTATLQILGVPVGLSSIILGVVIAIFAAVRYRAASAVAA